MGFEPGGRSDKLGNRYEWRWVAKQLLHLLNEELRSVTLEAVGDDEKGVDLWIETVSGTREAHQCKARNSSKEAWNISALKNRGVLERLRFQLDRIPEHEYVFVFVSGVPATLLGDICESARNSNDNPEDFYRYQVEDVGSNRRELFRQFCRALDIDADKSEGRSQAYNYLRRTRFELYPYDKNHWDTLLTLAGFLLTGAPETVISTLSNYAVDQDRLGKRIYPDVLRKYLVTQGIYSKDLASNPRITPVIERLRFEFEDSIRPGLIDKEIIHREETDKCLEALNSNAIVILHGSAGSGKSVVLYEVTKKLLDNKILYLPVRLDRRVPEHTAAHFGEDMRLPDSPTYCLAAVSGERQCVLILDQLDAVRWTCSHSANALDVCKELVDQVMSFQREGRAISVVISCRTFDLEHDPQIMNWFNDKKENNPIKIEVRPLPESIVREKVGESFEKMTERQRVILSNPQNLGMWIELHRSKNLPFFQSSTELMKQYWKFRKRQVEEIGIAAVDINAVLNCLVYWLDKEGKISAPDRIIFDCPTRAVEALKSHGILQEQNGRISFCHQSYLDFLIAQRILREIDAGGSILNWLGTRERQTLFHRGQLKQALTLLSDESPAKFLESVKQMLLSGDIRFHLKHLVLELLGQVEDIPSEIANYCLELLQVDYWKPHVLETVFLGNAPYIQILIKRGIIGKWLNSGSEEIINRALMLLQSVAERIPDMVTEQLVPFAEKGGEWLTRILKTICWRINNDSEAMFELRLNLARKGINTNYTDWKTLGAAHPLRAIRLMEAILSTWEIREESNPTAAQRTRLENWNRIHLKEISKVVENYPDKAWEMFIPHIVRLTLINASPYDNRLRKWKKLVNEEYSSTGYIEMARLVVELSIIAGKKLAKDKPDVLLKCTRPLENSESAIIQEIIMDAYSHLPGEYADVGINWLLADMSRFSFGDRLGNLDEPKWMPAVRLIEALSPNCSNDVFLKLEQCILHYHEPDEKQLAQYCLKTWKEGYFDHYWGAAQYFLLPALAPHRVKKSTVEMISVLKRKFAGYPERRLVGSGTGVGGFIGSKLDKNLEQISDHAWLNIIGNKNVTEKGRGNWKQVSKGKAAESSVWQFSRSLATIAKRYPERFGRLALQFPENTNQKYISAILEAMAQTRPGPEVPEDEKTSWAPASIDTVLAVWKRFCDIDDRQTARSFCRLMESRAIEELPGIAIEKLLYLAAHHPDLEPGKLNISCDKSTDAASVETLFQNTINCVRGVAAEAIGELLWHHPDWLDKLKPGIEALISDPHPVVRMAAIRTLLPLLNIDRHQAVEWFYEVAKGDTRIPASPYAVKFFNYTIREFSDRFKPLVSMMIGSSFADVSQKGAELVTAYHLFYGLFGDEFESCRVGTTPQRKGVAIIAADFIHDDKYAGQCRELLEPLFNDPENEVRWRVSLIFEDNFFDTPANVSLGLVFVQSKAFPDNASDIIRTLKDHKGSLLPCHTLILEICKVMTTTLLEALKDSRSEFYFNLEEIPSLLLRLYEQAQESNSKVANRCLDMWDELFEKRVGMTRELTKSIEK